MAHKYTTIKDYLESVQSRKQNIFVRESYKKYGKMYFGTIDNVDYLDESLRGKPLS